MKQNTSHVVMALPLHFEYNSEAAATNSFQYETELTLDELRERATVEVWDAVIVYVVSVCE